MTQFKGPAIEQIGTSHCTGCGGCIDACPHSALEMSLNEEGFYRPLLNSSTCTSCSLCSLHCPILATDHPSPGLPYLTNVFGGWSTQDAVRLSSSSGGIAYELSKHCLSAGGIVAGCALDGDFTAHHILVEDIHSLQQLQGSKYLQSNVHGIYKKLSDAAHAGRDVLFIGTSCQVSAFKTYLRSPWSEHVLLVSIVCFGVPSLRAWKNHLATSFSKRVQSISFRTKHTGWTSQRTAYTFTDGKTLFLRPDDDPFISGFYATAFHQPICHSCPFIRIPRCGDLTLGDFWGVPKQWEDKRGVSLIVASTSKGLNALHQLANQKSIYLFPSTLEEASAKNPRLVCNKPIEVMNPQRSKVMHLLLQDRPLSEIASLYQSGILRRLCKRIVPPSITSLIKTLFAVFSSALPHKAEHI